MPLLIPSMQKVNDRRGRLVQLRFQDGTSEVGKLGASLTNSNVFVLITKGAQLSNEFQAGDIRLLSDLDASSIGRIVDSGSTGYILTQQVFDSIMNAAHSNFSGYDFTISQAQLQMQDTILDNDSQELSNSDFKDSCPVCGAPAYVGFFNFECSKGCHLKNDSV